MSRISIKIADITKMDVECIVNAANEHLAQGGGVCGAIFAAAGAESLRKACSRIGHCDTGNAVITPGFGLKAKYIIHAVGPVWHGGEDGEEDDLYDCYSHSLELAMENDIHSIAFPLISSGIFGYPKQEAWEMAIYACEDFITNNEDYDIDITFAVLNEAARSLGQEMLDKIEAIYLPSQDELELREGAEAYNAGGGRESGD